MKYHTKNKREREREGKRFEVFELLIYKKQES
jgi:hypothetical protein